MTPAVALFRTGRPAGAFLSLVEVLELERDIPESDAAVAGAQVQFELAANLLLCCPNRTHLEPRLAALRPWVRSLDHSEESIFDVATLTMLGGRTCEAPHVLFPEGLYEYQGEILCGLRESMQDSRLGGRAWARELEWISRALPDGV